MVKFPYHKCIHLITITNPLRQVEQELTPSFINSSTWPWGVWGLSKTTATKVFKPNILTQSPVNSVLLRWVQNFEYTHCFGIDFQWVDVQLNSKWLLPSRHISKCRDQKSFHNTNLCINRTSTGLDTCRTRASNCLSQAEIIRHMCSLPRILPYLIVSLYSCFFSFFLCQLIYPKAAPLGISLPQSLSPHLK